MWAFRLSPSGFPLYLFPLTLQKDAASIPNAHVCKKKIFLEPSLINNNKNEKNILNNSYCRRTNFMR